MNRRSFFQWLLTVLGAGLWPALGKSQQVPHIKRLINSPLLSLPVFILELKDMNVLVCQYNFTLIGQGKGWRAMYRLPGEKAPRIRELRASVEREAEKEVMEDWFNRKVWYKGHLPSTNKEDIFGRAKT